MNRIVRLATMAGVAALLGGLMAAKPALADDDYARHHVREVRIDEGRLRDLERRRDVLRARCDWDGVRRIDCEIVECRRPVVVERYDVRPEIVTVPDRGYDRVDYRGHDDVRRRDDFRGRDDRRHDDRDDNRDHGGYRHGDHGGDGRHDRP